MMVCNICVIHIKLVRKSFVELSKKNESATFRFEKEWPYDVCISLKKNALKQAIKDQE